jgi:hypothetical protein
MTRRKVMQASLAVTMSLCMMAFTCSPQQWFALVNALLPLATDVAIQFATFAGKGTMPAAQAAEIKKYSSDAQTIFTDIGADVTVWQTTQDPSKLAHITALLASLKTQSTALIATFQITDPNTLAFITAIVQDSVDLAGLIPVIVHPAAGKMEVTMRVNLPKAKSLEDVFKARAANLPK